MVSKEARVELISYKTDNIAEAVTMLITNFVKYSGIAGAMGWSYALDRMNKIIERQEPRKFFMDAQGIRITFSGFPEPKPLKEHDTIFIAPEPNITIEGNWKEVRPRERTAIAVMTADIGREVSDIYHLREKLSPYMLEFPKERYAKTRAIVPAHIICLADLFR